MEKLIKEYRTKVELCDAKIQAIDDNLRVARKAKNKEDREALLDEKQLILSKRQCYVQFIKDLEDYA